MTTAELLIWGGLIHLICDWLLQSEWMATNKASLDHPAAWVHGMIHVVGLSLVFSFPWSLFLGLVHMLVDTRIPLAWWRKVYRQTDDPANPLSIHVAVWQDQTVHFSCIALVSLAVG